MPEPENKEQTEGWVGEQGPKCNEELQPPQPQQRVAIRIKLCCDCNSRHIQDACPLRNPGIIIGDAVIFGQWQNEKRLSRTNQSGIDEDGQIDKSATLENNSVNGVISMTNSELDMKNRSDSGALLIKTQTDSIPDDSNTNLKGENSYSGECTNDTKPFSINTPTEQRLTFAEASLPMSLELQVCDPTHGLSVITRCHLRQYTQFGPLVGQPIREMDIPDDFSMKDIWEVCMGNTIS